MPMPVDTSGRDRKPFYDPFYRPSILRLGADDCNRGWYDDFSVFNHLHLPRPPSSPRISADIRADQSRLVAPVKSGGQEYLCRKSPKIEVESDTPQDVSPKPSPRDAGKQALG
eukprot:TRINITY_DN7507_c0_g1_i1.p1 TRINITY_DN7507_c0_g1~~TRINITY_DN7507_c0_g1_i1.p1  ORF type:complete len:113 (-),score=16.59 TRINITY_DN7507_c0_g1_i1:550-888(-)